MTSVSPFSREFVMKAHASSLAFGQQDHDIQHPDENEPAAAASVTTDHFPTPSSPTSSASTVRAPSNVNSARPLTATIKPAIWFADNRAAEAVSLYVSCFPNSQIITSSPNAIEFELDGTRIVAITATGGPRWNGSFSFKIMCETQEEIDRVWERLSDGGHKAARMCGWTTDKYGIMWQVFCRELDEVFYESLLADTMTRMKKAIETMAKPDIAVLQKA
ncbi:3-demethylubiquinone-9 3-methyltransferase-domain-containing protein [Xylariaceae sp. FL0016]|nr:3-demethylubiquinone-9 3-methyltransferase-domain-containing protein [Xylariaceae sp. FL0016]